MNQHPLNGPRANPPGGAKARFLVVALHGYGSNGDDLMGLTPHWQPLLPGTAFAAPNAPEPSPGAPGGYQWFPISRIDPDAAYAGACAAAPALNRYLDQELARHGLDDRALALVGFSQGTMMALHAGLRRKVPPAAIVGFSGMLAGPDRLAAEMTVHPPIMLIHGDQDDLLPHALMFHAAQMLGGAGLAVQWHVSHGVGHGIGPDGVSIAGRFLADAFQGKA